MNDIDPYQNKPDPRLYWHPRIQFALWIVDWVEVALCYAFVWQFLAEPGIGNLKEKQAFVAIGARAGWIIAALVFLFVAATIAESWYVNAVQHVRAEYAAPHRAWIMAIFSAPFLVVLAPYVWFATWVLEATWTHFVLPRITLDPVLMSTQHDLSWPKSLWAIGIGVALCGTLYWLLRFSARAFVSHYAAALRQYGFRGTVKGMLIMTLMRAKARRKDFFRQTPIVNNAMFFAISIGIYMLIPIHGLNFMAGALLATHSVIYSLDLIAPPAWLFLGASSYESAFVFHDLRRRWLPRLGITLLDRDNPAWSAHYLYEAQELRKQGVRFASYMNNPSTPRIWSLRTRDNVWKHAVLVLMDFVAVVVIDARIVREGLQEELDWLFKSGRLEKAWILGVDDKDSPALCETLSEEVDAEKKIALLMERVVSGHKLYGASWADAGLQFPVSISQRNGDQRMSSEV
jgi:hypothetical protein